jgi:UDP-N-acetylmuramoyl-L-alanyl-D-glutamate--2,6-diaminopimelate ligase
MLNEKLLGSILGVTLPDLKLDDIHWKSQESTPSSLLFYRFGSDRDSQEIFLRRISNASFGWLIVNQFHPALPPNSIVLREEVWPAVQEKCLNLLYPLPRLKLIGLTGTNGKTTTAELVLQLGELIGKKGMSVGTLGVRETNKTLLEFGLTSPSLIDLRKFLFTFGKEKDFCVLEVSSHALVQRRVYGLEFDGAGWLSFSQDHLDYHQSMDSYFDSKCLLLNHLGKNAALFVPANEMGLFDRISERSFKAKKAHEITEKLPVFFETRFNRNNLEVAVAILQDVFKISVPKEWEKIIPPDGRFYIRPYKSSFIVVDFAHTPDALENVCKAIKEAFPNHKLNVLFGCGGDRDRTKRSQMGTVAESWANKIYLTSDNPRNEDPLRIIDDIAQGIENKTYEIEIDRLKAVQKAFIQLQDREVLLLAGKGHEDYILIKGVKHPYSDISEVDSFITRNSP